MAFGPRLLLIVMLAGALGGLAHSLRSICWYVGNRDLVWSWVGAYFLQPFIAASLALLFYLVIRGGFVPTGSNLTSTNVFGFAAMGGSVGMFTNQAMVKLRRVAETVFEAAEQGEDHQGPRNK